MMVVQGVSKAVLRFLRLILCLGVYKSIFVFRKYCFLIITQAFRYVMFKYIPVDFQSLDMNGMDDSDFNKYLHKFEEFNTEFSWEITINANRRQATLIFK